ncbi:hypothetical protein CYMTET_21244 [Cymbomonas tetramitiformis]|uniref:Uncharacterized protein n=1 Tax=Cymbomonas tetramitiformis TaxID=36881 RepID=A0AAE0G2S4_9CHLO|nr:hypothetical protein CYMTET_21244 [Cymbomonas tetramitiformis]
MVCRTSAKGKLENIGRAFFSCPTKDMRKPKDAPGNGCKRFVWADDIIHSLCSTAWQQQQFQIDNINRIDPGLTKKLYPDGVPFLYPETPHYPDNSFQDRNPSASLSDILSSR